MARMMHIGDRAVGDETRTFIVAELGINHDGVLERALQLVDAAADAGADAVKVQWFKASSMYYEKAGLYKTASGTSVDIFPLMKELELPLSWIQTLLDHASARGLLVFPSVCDLESLDEAERFEFPAYKVTSYEISHIPLLKALGSTGKPVIISTGGATLGDIEEALEALEAGGARDVALLHCVASYPTPLDEANLGVVTTLRTAFPSNVVGFSDHTEDPVRAPVEAVKLGGRIIEKHLTLSRAAPGPDHAFALEPEAFRLMVRAIRGTEAAIARGMPMDHDPEPLGSTRKTTLAVEAHLRRFAYRSIVARRDIAPGEVLTSGNIAVLRSGEGSQGIHPRYFELLIEGRFVATRYITAGRGVQWTDLLTTV